MRVGDRVVTWCDRRSRYAAGPVRKLFSHVAEACLAVTVRALDNRLETIRCTPNHPFWQQGQGWVPACRMAEGDTLKGASGPVEVVGVAPLPQPERVYNFEVGGHHNYLVGRAGALVHNKSDLAHPPALLGAEGPDGVPPEVWSRHRDQLRQLPMPRDDSHGYLGHQIAKGLALLHRLPETPGTPIHTAHGLGPGLVVFPRAGEVGADGAPLVHAGAFKLGAPHGNRFAVTNQPGSALSRAHTDPRLVMAEKADLESLIEAGYAAATPGELQWAHVPGSKHLHVTFSLPRGAPGARPIKPVSLLRTMMLFNDPVTPYLDFGGSRMYGMREAMRWAVIAQTLESAEWRAQLLQQTEHFSARLAEHYPYITPESSTDVVRSLQSAPEKRLVQLDTQVMALQGRLQLVDPYGVAVRGDRRFIEHKVELVPVDFDANAQLSAMFGGQLDLIAWANGRRSRSFPSAH